MLNNDIICYGSGIALTCFKKAIKLMRTLEYNTIVIGGGHAGLVTSYFLKQHNLSHLVFERHRIGNSWSSQRWDSFKLNTPSKYSILPGFDNSYMDPDGFLSATAFVSILEEYAQKYDLPVKENSRVLTVEKYPDSDLFQVTVSRYGNIRKYRSSHVVVASGAHSREIIPAQSSDVSPEITQLHAAEYRRADDLPEGAVLVVGSGQSGVQIAEDLLDSGRKVYLSTSRVARVPRRYRGKDVIDWLVLSGFLDQRTEDIADPQVLKMKQPQVSGVGPRGKTVSLQSLAKKGATVLGKTASINGTEVHFQPDAAVHVKFGDDFSQAVKALIEEYIDKAHVDAPASTPDEADLPDMNMQSASLETSINLEAHRISTIIWSSGFDGDLSYLKLPVFNEDGTLIHKGGIAEIRGLYIVGFPWLRKRQSGILKGITEDAEVLCQRIKKLNLQRMNREHQPHF